MTGMPERPRSTAGDPDVAVRDAPLTGKRPAWETRTPEQLREHYRIETVLAQRLLHSSREERRTLYAALYDELFRRVPHVPHAVQKHDPAAAAAAVARQLRVLEPLLSPESTFLEIGPGDCLLSFAVAQRVAKV